MCVDCRIFAGLWGRKFMGNRFAGLQYKTIHYFVKHLLGGKFVGKGNPWNPKTLNPHNQ